MKKIIFLLFLLSSCQACKDTTLIDISEPESTDVFRCKVNGVDWEPAGNNLGFSDSDLDIYYEKFFLNAIQIRATRDIANTSDFMSLSFFIESDVLGEHNASGNKMFTDYNCGNYYRDTLPSNIINIISMDSINNIIEGTFYFTAKEGSNSSCTVDEIVATDGYFKAKYRN